MKKNIHIKIHVKASFIEKKIPSGYVSKCFLENLILYC